jgi:hypothetical protein
MTRRERQIKANNARRPTISTARRKIKRMVIPHVKKVITKSMKKPDGTIKKKGNPYLETVRFNVQIGEQETLVQTSITLRKNIIALWVLMMDKEDEDPYSVVQEFIDKVCLKRWTGNTGKGMSDFVSKCMINSFLDEDDFLVYKKIYLGM